MRYFVFLSANTGEIKDKVVCEDTDDLTADGGIEVTRRDFEAIRLPEPPARPAPEPPELTDHERIEELERELMRLRGGGI